MNKEDINMTKKIGILMGSDSDFPHLKGMIEILDKFDLKYDVDVISAHRSPYKALKYAKDAKENGCGVIIAAAGGAAHLAGVIASHTTLPVIGIPMPSVLDGLDSLLSTVQMPKGVPVATVAIGSTGAVNAGVLACQILAVSDDALSRKLADYKIELAEKVDQASEKVKKIL